MSNFTDLIYTALNDLVNISADYISSYDLLITNNTQLYNAVIANLTVTNVLNFPLNYMWSNLINQSPALVGTNHLVDTHFLDNITQSSGSNQFLDTSIGSITQSESAVIVQSGNQWNQLKQTQVTDLSITGTLTLPSNVVIAGSSYTDDLIMNNATIQQTAPPEQINTFGATDFYNGDVRMNKNLTMIGGAETVATLKNLVVEGNSNMGLIISPTITDLDTRILTNKNDITAINTNLLLKADTSYVNTQLALKDDITSVNSKLALKANLTGPTTFSGTTTIQNFNNTGTFNSPALQTILNGYTTSATYNAGMALKANLASPIFTGTVTATNIQSTSFYIPQSSGGLYYYAGTTANLTSRIAFSSSNVMFWDNYSPTNIQFRYGVTPVAKQTFFNNGDVSITGNILNCPTITSKADISYVDSQLLLKDNVLDVNNKLLLKDDITSVNSKCLILQDQIDDIVASEYYESINVGSVTTLDPEQPATVINSGSNINAVLDFAIPRGYKGDKGDRGPKGDDGSDGKDGSDGSNGSDGDSSAATAAAIAAAASAGVAAGAAAGAAGAASAAAGSAAASAASAALAQVGIQELNVKVTGLQTQVDTLGEGMTQLDNDVIALKTKTQYVTAVGGITTINSTLNTNTINANSLYVADSITVVDDVKASGFSGGLLSTNIKGQNINIGTNEALINTIQIGGASSIVTINGFVNYTNPFNNFFAQW